MANYSTNWSNQDIQDKGSYQDIQDKKVTSGHTAHMRKSVHFHLVLERGDTCLCRSEHLNVSYIFLSQKCFVLVTYIRAC
jgi:hypothetical protein